MKRRAHNRVIVPAGAYFLGDPGYAGFSNEEWALLCDETDAFTKTPIGHVRGVPVLAFHTEWGDGEYECSNGFWYNVDSGCIGLVPMELVTLPLRENGGGSTIEFTEPTKCYPKYGFLVFGDIVINTNLYDKDGEILLKATMFRHLSDEECDMAQSSARAG